MTRRTLELNNASAAAALTPAARTVHRQVLEHFAGAGTAASRQDLERFARKAGGDSGAILAELGERDIVAFDDHGEALPASALRRPHCQRPHRQPAGIQIRTPTRLVMINAPEPHPLSRRRAIARTV